MGEGGHVSYNGSHRDYTHCSLVRCHHSGVVSLTLSALGDLLVMCTGTVYTCVHATDKTYQNIVCWCTEYKVHKPCAYSVKVCRWSVAEQW